MLENGFEKIFGCELRKDIYDFLNLFLMLFFCCFFLIENYYLIYFFCEGCIGDYSKV